MTNGRPQKPLRKQPRRRSLQAASSVSFPQLQLPKTAEKRRRRKQTEPVRFGISSVRRVIFSARWISLALVIVSALALVEIYREPRFYLTYIPVEGSVAISPPEIARASGLAGSHVFAADPLLAARKIDEISGVISATVTLKWPNQLFIKVAEETAVAVWSEEGKEYGITSSGRLIPAVRTNPTLLRIESDSNLAQTAFGISSGLTQQAGQPQMQDAPENAGQFAQTAAPETSVPNASITFVPREVLEGALQLQTLRPTITTLSYQSTGGLSYQDGRGWRGYFGTGSSMNQKLAVYESIVSSLLAQGLQPEYISVSNYEKPFYKTVGAVEVPEEEIVQ